MWQDLLGTVGKINVQKKADGRQENQEEYWIQNPANYQIQYTLDSDDFYLLSILKTLCWVFTGSIF